LIYALVVVVLLVFRIPPVRRGIASLRDRILLPLTRRRIQPENPHP
jgi:hypothetical protein